MRYITFSYHQDGSQLLGTNSCRGDYASDKNAVRYMNNYAQNALSSTINGEITRVRLYRYTNIYDDSTFKLIHTWGKDQGNE